MRLFKDQICEQRFEPPCLIFDLDRHVDGDHIKQLTEDELLELAQFSIDKIYKSSRIRVEKCEIVRNELKVHMKS
jgi:hypothetical protein